MFSIVYRQREALLLERVSGAENLVPFLQCVTPVLCGTAIRGLADVYGRNVRIANMLT